MRGGTVSSLRDELVELRTLFNYADGLVCSRGPREIGQRIVELERQLAALSEPK